MRDKIFWLLAFAFFVIGDSVTTMVGLSLPGIIEVGPAAKPMLEAFGFVAMFVAKGIVFGMAFGVWRHSETSDNHVWKYVTTTNRMGIPIGIALVGVMVTLWNSYVILSVIA